MNWIQGIQRAIDYVEANITEELDFEEVAKQAYSSPFHFQRVFGILCGVSLGDYIRMRRLSLAGEELSRGNAKIHRGRAEIRLRYAGELYPRLHPIPRHHAERGKARRQGQDLHAPVCQIDLNRRQKNGLQN